MKRILGLLALATMLVTPSLAFAEQIGIYVAPKFIYGFTQMQGMKTSGAFDDTGTMYPFSKNIGNKTDNAYGGALAIGYDFNKKFQVPARMELEYAIFSEVSGKKSWKARHPHPGWAPTERNYSSKQKLNIQTLFVNAYYDFHNSTAFTPYVGGGLGFAFIHSKGSFIHDNHLLDPNQHLGLSLGSKTSTNFAWNVGAGVAYAFTDYISLDLSYRFAGLGKAETKSVSGQTISGASFDETWTVKSKTRDIYMHQVMLGLRVTF